MKYSLAAAVLLIGVLGQQQQAMSAAAPGSPVSGGPKVLTKVFNYQGSMPIKDDRTGETIRANDSNETASTGGSSSSEAVRPTGEVDPEAEAACWRLINEQSAVTFALQKRVLDELQEEMKNLTMEAGLRESVEKITNKMRANMDEAIEALKRDAADEFFDALFDSSEDIIYLSATLRDPKMEEKVFLTLVKAVSRLGRNNSALIQEFTSMCSFDRRSPPRPRFAEWGSL